MQKIMYRAWVKAQMAKQSAKEEAKKFFVSEDGGADGIIIAVIIIIVVVALGIIFRDQIGSWLNTLFGIADEAISNVNGTPSGF